MGMYTELVLKANLMFPTGGQVHMVFNYLWLDGGTVCGLPDHPFFRTPRWPMLGRCSSYYHHPEGITSVVKTKREDDIQDWYVFIRTDIKNYDDEISKFIDWVMPYVYEDDGKCIGWTWYEEEDVPTLIMKKKKEG